MRKLKNIKKHQNNNNNNKKQKRKKKHETKKQKQKNKWGKSQFLWHNLNQFSHDRSVRRYHSFRYTTQKIKFSIKHFFSKYDHENENADLVTFTEQILDGKLLFFVQ